MKNLLKAISLLIIFILALTFVMCKEPAVDSVDKPSEAIFDIPSSFTGAGGRSGSEHSRDTVDDVVNLTMSSYYSHVRWQILEADMVAGWVKAMLVYLEAINIGGTPLFEYEDIITHTEDSEKIRWTPNGDNSYFLEVWNMPDSTYQKSFELEFQIIETSDAMEVEGSVIMDFTADSEYSEYDGEGNKNAEMAKVEFDSNRDGKKWMKIFVTGILGNELDPENLPTEQQPDTAQEVILELTQDAEGIIEVSGCTSIPGIRDYKWNAQKAEWDSTESQSVIVPDETIDSELRYYVFRGIGNLDDRATVNLGVPLDYTAENVFTDYSIGDIILQLETDKLRNDWVYEVDSNNDPVENETGHEKLDNIYTFLETTPPADYTTLTNDDIVQLCVDVIDKLETDQPIGWELYLPLYQIAYRLMTIENPAYFTTSQYQGYGSGDYVPDDVDQYPTIDNVSLEVIPQADVDELTIEFNGDLTVDF